MQNTWKIKKYTSLTSTNDVAKEISVNIDVPTLIVADIQTAGRGRRENKWISQNGNLFFSQVFTPKGAISDLAFVTSLSLAETVYNFDKNVNISIKWPNDILINEQKIAGILIEKTIDDKVVVGVGVNILSNPDNAEIPYSATNLSAQGIKINKEELIKSYLEVFDKNYADCLQSFDIIREKWLRYASHLNRKIMVKRKNMVDEGIFKGIDEQGLLLLEQEDKLTAIAVAEVFF